MCACVAMRSDLRAVRRVSHSSDTAKTDEEHAGHFRMLFPFSTCRLSGSFNSSFSHLPCSSSCYRSLRCSLRWFARKTAAALYRGVTQTHVKNLHVERRLSLCTTEPSILNKEHHICGASTGPFWRELVPCADRVHWYSTIPVPRVSSLDQFQIGHP